MIVTSTWASQQPPQISLGASAQSKPSTSNQLQQEELLPYSTQMIDSILRLIHEKYNKGQLEYNSDGVFKCLDPYCPYVTPSKQVLEMHLSNHMLRKNFPCQHCTASYEAKAGFGATYHEMLHNQQFSNMSDTISAQTDQSKAPENYQTSSTSANTQIKLPPAVPEFQNTSDIALQGIDYPPQTDQTLSHGTIATSHTQQEPQETIGQDNSSFQQEAALISKQTQSSVLPPYSQQMRNEIIRHIDEKNKQGKFECNSNGKFKCLDPYCPQSFSSENDLKKHLETHTLKKQILCDFCTASFDASKVGPQTRHSDLHKAKNRQLAHASHIKSAAQTARPTEIQPNNPPADLTSCQQLQPGTPLPSHGYYDPQADPLIFPLLKQQYTGYCFAAPQNLCSTIQHDQNTASCYLTPAGNPPLIPTIALHIGDLIYDGQNYVPITSLESIQTFNPDNSQPATKDLANDTSAQGTTVTNAHTLLLQPLNDALCDKLLEQIHTDLQNKSFSSDEHDNYKCPDPFCYYTVKKTKDRFKFLRDHIHKLHPTTRRVFKCRYCTASHNYLHALKLHEGKHEAKTFQSYRVNTHISLIKPNCKSP